jgi:hypothetical protein
MICVDRDPSVRYRTEASEIPLLPELNVHIIVIPGLKD